MDSGPRFSPAAARVQAHERVEVIFEDPSFPRRSNYSHDASFTP